MRLRLLNTLFLKIFSGFWLLILLLSTAIILLPTLDSRQLQPLNKHDIKYLQNQQERIDYFNLENPNANFVRLLDMTPLKSANEFYLTDLNGRLLSDSAPAKMRNFMADSGDPSNPHKKINLHKTYFGPLEININGQHRYLYFSNPNQKKSLKVVEWLIDNPLLLLLLALLISTPLCAYISWHLTQPLRHLKQIANEVSKGKLDTPFPDIKNSEEFNGLANAMKLMITSLKNMLKNQQRLLSDISHELRSPLTRLNLALAIAKKQEGENIALQRIEIEASRIETMIADMLNISRIQLSQHDLEQIPLVVFLDDLFLDAEFEAKENGKCFSYPTLHTTEISVYHELAYRAIENVIRNAIKYAEKHIIAEIQLKDKYISISIRNDGPLIPSSELTNIFRPFYRLNASRERETGGAGLGLSIAENAMFKHGGRIWAENKNNQVYLFLQFPRVSK